MAEGYGFASRGGFLQNEDRRRGHNRGQSQHGGQTRYSMDRGQGFHRGRGIGRGRRGGGGEINRGRGTTDGRRGGFRGRGSGRRQGLDIRELKELSEKDPSTIVMTLGLESGIGLLLERDFVDEHMMCIVLNLLAKASRCATTPGSVNQILLTVHHSSFYQHVSTILNKINRLSFDIDRRQLVKDLLTFMKELYFRLPHSFMDVKVLGVETLLNVVIDDLASGGQDDEMRETFTELQGLKTTVLENIERKQRTKESYKDGDPPDDFREISIFPTVDDIQPDGKPFLRKNKTTGGYRDLAQYLDVQFRLLREDFICPLREGIEEYLAAEVPGKRGQRLKDIRVYQDVHILRTVCTDGGLLHRLIFDVSRLRRVRWENSKRLIFGSLLCLSRDNFQTFLFATVSERDPKMLKEGYIDVTLENSDELDDIDIDTKFVMVETTAFFEAYRHVLRGLQLVREGDLPFERYIVTCENNVNPPKYLQQTRSPKFDLRPLVDEQIVLREDAVLLQQGREVSYAFSLGSLHAERVHVLKNMDWPTADMLHLDDSQYRALKTALTKEFAIIQGPPGTGKTYVGLKIVKALLHNSKLWKIRHRSPMLIVCYTNHALDQFLEGIISFYQGSVIRVGSRISNEHLEKYSLGIQRRKARNSDERDMKTVRRRRYEIRERMMKLRYDIENTGMRLEAAERTILHEDMLRPFMREHYNTMLKTMEMMHQNLQIEMNQYLPFPRSFMNEWLGVGNMESMIEWIEAEKQGGDNVWEEEDDEAGIDVQGEAEVEQDQRRIHDLDFMEKPHSDLTILQKKIEDLKLQQSEYVAFNISDFDKQTTDGQFQLTPKAKKQVKRRLLGRLRSSQRMTAQQRNQIYDPWYIPMEERWKLYRYWVHGLCQKLRKDIQENEKIYKKVVAEYKELQMVEDKQILQEATVIGMTTTAAARYQQALAEIGPRIIVVEEAAEVLEGHIITTLSKRCEHLILIGDHKQLKPNPTVYKLAKQHNLDLSLFERMISNGIQCDTLALQHRMRPEISSLMRHIYPQLMDHPCVFNYENVKGISHNILFIDHKNPEEHDADLYSHSNAYEATYIVALCDYLLKQGYDRSQITVLTTYSGQLLKLKKLMPKSEFQGVRLTVVDNYQGEENDIILLSLVRSNDEGSVGFLKIENRICVALSRAKIGLFVIGNFELLAQQSLLWKDLLMDLRKNDRTGTTLNLYCQNHPSDVGIPVQTPDDFKRAPEGGCLKPCTFRLDCGHVCARLCHPYDPQHKEYLCMKSCLKTICDNEHSCPKLCHQQCGECTVRIEKIIPSCGHTQMVPCFMKPTAFSCKEACEKTLECGHTCGRDCGLPHQCTKLVKKTFRCGHTGDVFCFRRDQAECEAKCTQELSCGHRCEGNCKTCHEGRLHVPCRKNCEKKLMCNHKCGGQCSDCPSCNKGCENHCPHTKCTKYCHKPCTPCREECKWRCEHYVCSVPCSEPCNRPPCNEPCKKLLRCKHPCIGLCGEPCPKQCRKCNKEEVCQIFFGSEGKPDARFVYLEDCSHIVEVTALDRHMKSESNEIKLKECPHCKTSIRHNMRYGNSIKKTLNNIEVVKKHFGNRKDDVQNLKYQMMTKIDETDDEDEVRMKEGMLYQGFTNTQSGLTALENKFSFLDALSRLLKEYETLEDDVEINSPDELAVVQRCIHEAKIFGLQVMKPRPVLSDQEESDYQNEILRHKAIIKMKKLQMSIAGSPRAAGYFLILEDILLSGKAYTKEKQTRANVNFDRLEERKRGFFGGTVDIEEEKVMMVHDAGMAAGHWVTCKKGHVNSVLDVTSCQACQDELFSFGILAQQPDLMLL